MKVLGIIPARGGSKGVPKKNSKLLAGEPLISYTIEAALHSNLLTDVLVSSDDDALLALAKSFQSLLVLKRPSQLATDESPTILTVKHALEFLKSEGKEYDAICLLQPTNPLRTSNFIDAAILKFKQTITDSLLSVLEVPHQYNPHWVFESTKANTLKLSTGESQIITRRQELPACYYRDGAIYLTRTNIVLNEHSLYGTSIGYIKSDPATHINIDSMEDWESAEKLIMNNCLR